MTARRRLALALLLAGFPTAGAAQACVDGSGTGASLLGGRAWYDVGDTSGASYGVALAAARGGGTLEGRVRSVRLDGADPLMADLALVVAPVAVEGVHLCPTFRAGASTVAADGADIQSLAGGVGARVAVALPVGAGRLTPWMEVRGLAGWTRGSAFDEEIDATGLALGLGLGARLSIGWAELHLTGSVDGFDDGLGFPPYPNRSVEAGLGVRF